MVYYNSEWYIIENKIKVETNNVAISKDVWLLDKIFWMHYM